MVAERPVIRMLLYSHYLYGIIPVGLDTRKHVFTELVISTHALFILSHAYVAFINQQWFGFWHKFFHHPPVFFFRCPHLGRKNMRLLVLHNARGISRNTFAAATVPGHQHLIQLSMNK